MPLSATAIAKATAKEKPLKLFDGGGLFLLIQPSGSKWWRFKYRFHGKEKLLSLGVYPEITLALARERRDKARELVAQGIDPSVERKVTKAVEGESGDNTFEAVAREWIEKNAPSWTPGNKLKIERLLKNNIFPWFKNRPINTITAPELLKCLRRIEVRKAYETAHRALQNCGAVLRFAVAAGKAERDFSADLRGALVPADRKHHASITDPAEVGVLMQAIAGYKGSYVTCCALKLAPLTFVRPGELRKAEWKEIDFEAAEWRLASGRMKARQKHIVPLSKQALTILAELKPLTGANVNDRYLFPGARTKEKPMSENTINSALRLLGYDNKTMTGHGFRSMASTLLNENGWNRDAIERQLAHGERNKVRGAYNYAEFLPERRKMMQWWADYLDQAAEKAVTSKK
jgi:integrase